MANYTIIPGNSGVFYLKTGAGKNMPKVRGQVLPFLDEANETITFRDTLYNFNAPLAQGGYADYINNDTGAPFASFDEALAFLVSYVLPTPISASPSILRVKVFSIVAAPAASNEKAPGQTIQDDDLIGATVAFMIINSDLYSTATITFDDTTGDIGLNPANPNAFADGDTVVVVFNT